MTTYTRLDSPIGPLLLTSDGEALTGVLMGGSESPQIAQDWRRNDDLPLFAAARTQFTRYFAGELRVFSLPLSLIGTPFQRRVWQALAAVAYGQTTTYGRLAVALGMPTASRAVGLANGQNPLAIVVPCHCVIGASGALTGYAGGLPRKAWLLALEQGRPLPSLAGTEQLRLTL